MENNELKQKSSRPVSLFLLIPALLFGLISLIMAIVGLGFIPILPSVAGILFCVLSLIFFKRSYRRFAIVIISISLVASLISVFRGTIFKSKVATDVAFDSTLVKTQEGIDIDLNEALGDSVTLSDTTLAPSVINVK